jgi:hypothetical protein
MENDFDISIANAAGKVIIETDGVAICTPEVARRIADEILRAAINAEAQASANIQPARAS